MAYLHPTKVYVCMYHFSKKSDVSFDRPLLEEFITNILIYISTPLLVYLPKNKFCTRNFPIKTQICQQNVCKFIKGSP